MINPNIRMYIKIKILSDLTKCIDIIINLRGNNFIYNKVKILCNVLEVKCSSLKYHILDKSKTNLIDFLTNECLIVSDTDSKGIEDFGIGFISFNVAIIGSNVRADVGFNEGFAVVIDIGSCVGFKGIDVGIDVGIAVGTKLGFDVDVASVNIVIFVHVSFCVGSHCQLS